jgi:hypothetical protein
MKKIMFIMPEHVSEIDFSEITQESEDNLTYNELETLTYITWQGDNPSSVQSLIDNYNYPVQDENDINELSFTDKWMLFIG